MSPCNGNVVARLSSLLFPSAHHSNWTSGKIAKGSSNFQNPNRRGMWTRSSDHDQKSSSTGRPRVAYHNLEEHEDEEILSWDGQSVECIPECFHRGALRSFCDDKVPSLDALPHHERSSRSPRRRLDSSTNRFSMGFRSRATSPQSSATDQRRSITKRQCC